MAKSTSIFLALATLLSVCASVFAQSDVIPGDKLALPIFFFHGVTANATAARNVETNLTAEGRVFTSLTFCQDLCSVQALNNQIPMAIAQIRSIVAKDARYDNGYVFVSHSQGGAIARGVIEEMDDHKVKVFVSFAGAVNGGFNGPQPEDAISLYVFVNFLGPRLLPATLLDFSKYTPADYYGKVQHEFGDLAANTPGLQSQYSAFNLGRTPFFDQWVKTNPYFPKINNVNICEASDAQCVADKQRRRTNFLKLNQAHFFASAGDDVISPWQQSHLASYTEVSSSEEVESKWAGLKILDVKETREYTSDTYGLKTLDQRGGLFFHTAKDIGHNCWLSDYTAAGQTIECKFKPLYNDVIYPAFQSPAFFYARPQC